MNTKLIDFHDGHGDDDDYDTELLIIKIVFIPAAFAIAMFFGILPAKVKACKESPKFLGLANAFSGGLFLAIALIHLLPEAAEHYNEWYEHNHSHDDPDDPHDHLQHGDGHGHDHDHPPVPLPYILVFLGYVLILLIDKVMFDSHALFDDHGHSHIHHHHGHGHGHSHGHKHEKLTTDPAARKLMASIKKSMIKAEEDIKAGGSIKKSMIQEQ